MKTKIKSVEKNRFELTTTVQKEIKMTYSIVKIKKDHFEILTQINQRFQVFKTEKGLWTASGGTFGINARDFKTKDAALAWIARVILTY